MSNPPNLLPTVTAPGGSEERKRQIEQRRDRLEQLSHTHPDAKHVRQVFGGHRHCQTIDAIARGAVLTESGAWRDGSDLMCDMADERLYRRWKREQEAIQERLDDGAKASRLDESDSASAASTR